MTRQAHEAATLRVDDRDGALRDRAGRQVFLRGINAGGRSKWSPFMPFDMPEDSPLSHVRELAHHYFARLRRWGLNVARVLLIWEALEPQRGRVDARYLDRLEALLDAARAHQVGVILDAHQDLFAVPLGGDGFPRWALPPEVERHGRPQHRAWFLGYALDARVARSFDRLWRDEDGLKEAFLGMWLQALGRLGQHKALLGVELLNEPGWGSARDLEAFKRQVLLPFYERLIARIHARWPRLIVCYGMPGVEFAGRGAAEELRPAGQALMYAPHLYDPSLLLTRAGGMSLPPERALARLGRWQRTSGTPVLLGEFGVTHGAHEGLTWLDRVLRGLDRHGLHATLWECSQTAQRWNGEDLNVLGPQGQEREIVGRYARPWVRAVGGQLTAFEWDATAGEVYVRWRSNGAPLELSLGGRRPRHVEVLAPMASWEVDDEATTMWIVARAGAHVTLLAQLEPRSVER